MRYGQKWLGKHRKMGSTYCAQCCPVFISSKNSVKIWPKKNFLNIAATTRSNGGQKANFSKKCIFRAENGIFLKNSFYSKFISDQKYIIYMFKKNFFFLKLWFSNFHRIQPKYIISRKWIFLFFGKFGIFGLTIFFSF